MLRTHNRKCQPCVGSIGHLLSEVPTTNLWELVLNFSNNKSSCRKSKVLVGNSDRRMQFRRTQILRILEIIALHVSRLVVVLYVTTSLTFGISDNICVTVCMQHKFETKFCLKKVHGFVVGNSDRVYDVALGWKCCSDCNARDEVSTAGEATFSFLGPLDFKLQSLQREE